jgi:hypothetical protein
MQMEQSIEVRELTADELDNVNGAGILSTLGGLFDRA